MLVAIIDTGECAPGGGDHPMICARVDRQTLAAAGMADAAGLVAGTDNDEENLRILLSARAFKPDGFLVVRQNHHENEVAFNATNANLIMQPSLVLARHVLLYLLTPLLGELLRHLHTAGAARVQATVTEAYQRVPRGAPLLWTERLKNLTVGWPGCNLADTSPRLGDLLRHPANRERQLDALPLVIRRDTTTYMLPKPGFEVADGDTVLFCGTRRARQLLGAALENPYTLYYQVTGNEPPRGWFFRWLAGQLPNAAVPAEPMR